MNDACPQSQGGQVSPLCASHIPSQNFSPFWAATVPRSGQVVVCKCKGPGPPPPQLPTNSASLSPPRANHFSFFRELDPKGYTVAKWHHSHRRLGSLLLPGQTLQFPLLDVNLSQPLTRLDELNDVDDLLRRHDGEADTGDDPRNGGIHLVGSCKLESRGAVRVGEDLVKKRRVDLGAGMDVGCHLIIADGLEEGRRKEGR